MIIPPGETIIEKKICPISGQEFIITDQDLEFYDKVSPIFNGKKYVVPSPTLCPEERTRRRFCHRNERHLYNRKCDLTGKQIISNYRNDLQTPVYDTAAWFGDGWTALDYGIAPDFDKPFFEQFHTLEIYVPKLALAIVNCENCNYCNYVGNVKDSYLIFGSVYCEKCYYGSPYYCKDCIDSLIVRKSERCFECVDCTELMSCMYCQDCHSSHDLSHCIDCKGCTYCIGSIGLRNATYYIFNEKVSPEAYSKYCAKDIFSLPNSRQEMLGDMRNLYLSRFHKHVQGENNANVSGNYLFNCKNSHGNFYTDRCEDTRFCQQIVDCKNCFDTNFTEENSWCYEYIGNYHNNNCLFSKLCRQVSHGIFCNSCFNSTHLFLCDGIKSGHHCILNKPYSIQEYEIRCGKIIDHMRSTDEWGEFFPYGLSPFGYNESVAQEYFPMIEEKVKKRGRNWYDGENKNMYIGPFYIPLPIREYNEKIVGYAVAQKNINALLEGIIRCEVTKKPFKIIKQELVFYIENGIPIPTKHSDERHKERMALRNPRKLFERQCIECSTAITTTYAPERPEKVVCEECYRKLVY